MLTVFQYLQNFWVADQCWALLGQWAAAPGEPRFCWRLGWREGFCEHYHWRHFSQIGQFGLLVCRASLCFKDYKHNDYERDAKTFSKSWQAQYVVFLKTYISPFWFLAKRKCQMPWRASLKLVMGRVDCNYLIEVPLSPLPLHNAATFLSDRPCAKFLSLNWNLNEKAAAVYFSVPPSIKLGCTQMQNDAFWQNPVLQKAFHSRFFFVFINKNNFMLRIAENGFIAIRPSVLPWQAERPARIGE